MRQRIATEISRLRREEQDVVAAVESALAKENLDKEQNVAGVSSDSVQRDVDSIMGRISRNKIHRDTLDRLVSEARTGVLDCLRDNQQQTLLCANQVSAFRTAVQTVEKVSSSSHSETCCAH